jgi:arylsulfatase A-like enzyme
MPTVLDIAGVPIPSTIDGKSLVPLVRDEKSDWRKYIHGEHCTCYAAEQEMQYVTDGRSKFVWLPRIGQEQFFDLSSDPGECRNLIDDPAHREAVDLWRGRLIAELKERDCGWVRGGKLYCPPEPLISPYKSRRWEGRA